MTPNHPPPAETGQPNAQETTSALFANLVIQQTNTALMLLGRVPNPETGECIQDLETARHFIDQLEMIEVKTKGNLDKREDQLLKQSLTALRMAFVEAVESPSGGPAASPSGPKPSNASSETSARESVTPSAAAPAAAEEESRKKFSKKY